MRKSNKPKLALAKATLRKISGDDLAKANGALLDEGYRVQSLGCAMPTINCPKSGGCPTV